MTTNADLIDEARRGASPEREGYLALDLAEALESAEANLRLQISEAQRIRTILDQPDPADFVRATEIEARYQRVRWDVDHDGGKTDADWFWLIGYLAGKALHAPGSFEKKLHRITTVAAACANWHAALLGRHEMRPGIDPPADE